MKRLEETISDVINEMAVRYNGDVNYDKEKKFLPISSPSISRMRVLSTSDDFVCTLAGDEGFIFVAQELGGEETRPVMRLKLRRDRVYPQVYGLRIQERVADRGLAKLWYKSFIDRVGPIMSDREHLQGGHLLWKSLLRFGKRSPRHEVVLFDVDAEKVVTTDPEESDVWSLHPDRSKFNRVLVLGKRGAVKF